MARAVLDRQVVQRLHAAARAADLGGLHEATDKRAFLMNSVGGAAAAEVQKMRGELGELIRGGAPSPPRAAVEVEDGLARDAVEAVVQHAAAFVCQLRAPSSEWEALTYLEQALRTLQHQLATDARVFDACVLRDGCARFLSEMHREYSDRKMGAWRQISVLPSAVNAAARLQRCCGAASGSPAFPSATPRSRFVDKQLLLDAAAALAQRVQQSPCAAADAATFIVSTINTH